MHPQTLYPKTKQVLENISKLEFMSGWYLAGGTALALQLGHRKSIDLDYFTDNFPKRETLLGKISTLNPKIISEAPGTVDTVISDVKVSFLEYKYPVLQEFVKFESVMLASVIDIACMKMSAISSRGSKKDLIDLYFILQKYSLKEIFDSMEKKFEKIDYQNLHILKSILYFSDADNEPDPDYIITTSWSKIKSSLEEEVKSYFRLFT